MWDNEAVDGKDKTRHVFMFPTQLVMTKPSKSGNVEEYEYKNTCQVGTELLYYFIFIDCTSFEMEKIT